MNEGNGRKMKHLEVVAAAIIQEGRLLAAQRGYGRYKDFWEFPGGKREEGETLEACLQRELFEELGIVAACGAVLMESVFEYEHGVFELIAVETEILKGAVRLTVHDKAEWVPVQELLRYQLLPADVPIARLLVEKAAGR